MVKFDAVNLEKRFRAAASIRISAKNRNDSRYDNDSGYWTGGRCNWGGSHSLSEDCHTLELLTKKIDDLKNVKGELEQSTSKQEFDSVKSRLTRQAQEVENNLRAKTGGATSIGGICIIWEEYVNFIEAELRPLRNEVKRLKEEISRAEYKFFEELKLLKLEQKQIEARIKENKQKATTEKDPEKKAVLLLLVEEDEKNLKENLRKQKEIPTSNFKFDPDEYVSKFLDKLEKSLSSNRGNSGGSSGGSGSRNHNPPNDDGDPNDPFNPSNSNNSNPNSPNNSDQNPPNFFQENQTLILIGAVILLFFWFFSSKETEPELTKTPSIYDYDF